MYSTHNEGESVIAERFMGTLRNKIYKHLTSISKKVYIDKLDDIVDKFRRRIKMNLVDIKPSTHINSSKGISDLSVISDLKGEEIVGAFYEN